MITLLDIVEWTLYAVDALVARCRADTLRMAKTLHIRTPQG